MPEQCGICGETVPFSVTVHMMVHTKGDDGVIDQYICQRCYEDRVEPLLE